MLVKDEEIWRKQSDSRNGSLASHLLSYIVCPVLTVKALWKKIVRSIRANQYLPLTSIDTSYNRTWLEILAVLPRQQGRGIARRLLSECESFTKTIGRDAIGLMVSRSSERAIRLYKRIGYQKIAGGSDEDFYVKKLDFDKFPDEVSDR